jgi:hypothetical protein
MTSLFPPRESLVSDIPARDGNIEKLFYGATLAKTIRLLSSKLLYGIKMINKHYNFDEKAHHT